MSKENFVLNTNALIDKWIARLDEYSIEQILAKPSEGSWSIGQVYIHLWMSAKGFFFKNVQRIADGDERVKAKGRKNFIGWMVFTFGKMPSVKIEMPGSVAVQPNPPESKEQIVKRMNEIKALVQDVAEKVESGKMKGVVKHPFLGFLSAQEWAQLCAIHFNHHEKQVQRIRKHFDW